MGGLWLNFVRICHPIGHFLNDSRTKQSWLSQKPSKRILARSGSFIIRAVKCGFLGRSHAQLKKPLCFRCLDAEPNAAHRALATFCLPETLARVAPSLDPKWSAPLLITQNMDALSSRVLSSFSSADKEAAEKCIIEMHGCIFETRCTSCAHVQRAYTPTPSSDALAAAQASESPVNIPVEDLPRCGGPGCTSNRYGRCGGLLRPNVVWFGEVPKHMGDIAMRMNWCDLLLLVGTSTTVSLMYSRATLALMLRWRCILQPGLRRRSRIVEARLRCSISSATTVWMQISLSWANAKKPCRRLLRAEVKRFIDRFQEY